jgi:predicted fused transcriptional regulator/phosphomethylpyrimidine kinase
MAKEKYIRSAATAGNYLEITCIEAGIWDVVVDTGTWGYEA